MSAVETGKSGASFQAIFALYDPTSTDALEELVDPIARHITDAYYPQVLIHNASTSYSTFYEMFVANADQSGAGVDKVVGSRLLPPKSLTEDGFQDALIQFLGQSGGRLYMVSGKGVWNAEPRGGGNSVNPAWRKALIHAGK